MEVGVLFFTSVEQRDAASQIGKKRFIYHFGTQCVVEAFGQKQCHGRFGGFVGYGTERQERANIFYALKVSPRTFVEVEFQQGERLQQQTFHSSPL
jgi:hypothetical protein